ncbi:MAG: hypothetical protein ABJE95_21460 [Byssovorax sp.]
MSNDRGQGSPPRGPQNPGAGRPLRGPQVSTTSPQRGSIDPRGSERREPERREPERREPERRDAERREPARADDLAHLYRKIADLQADCAESEARAVKAEREQSEADGMLGQMLARVAEVEGRLRAEQKLRVEGEAMAAQAGKLRASQAEMLERLQTLESQAERARLDLTHARREAATHRLAADDQLHLLAKEREDTAALLARLEREQRDREGLRARVVELDRAASERNEALARARDLQAELEAIRSSSGSRERDLSSKLEQAWVEIRHAHDSADALEDQLADVRDKLAASHTAAESARRELAAERALASEVEADVTRLELASEAGERSLSAERARAIEVESRIARLELAKETGERALAAERAHAIEIEADVARLELDREAGKRAVTAERARAAEAEANVARLELAREAGERALTEARAELARVRAAHESALLSLRESHTVELADALSERSRRERSSVDAEIAAGRRDLQTLEDALAEARRQLDLERAATAEAQSLLAGEREWVAEMEEDSLRREEDLEKTRRAQTRADAHARAAEARRTELEDTFAETERALATHRGELEALRVEAAMHRMRIGELERERELRAGLIEVNAVPAEIERLRRRVASAEARAAQMHTELADAIDEVTHLLTELERREMDTGRVRTTSLASARSLLEHVIAATRPAARPSIEPASSTPPPAASDAPPRASEAPRAAEPSDQAVDIVDEITAERRPEPAAAATVEVDIDVDLEAAPADAAPIDAAATDALADAAPSRPSAGPPPLPTTQLLSFPAAPPIVGLPALTDEDEDEMTAVVDRDAIQPPPS